MEFDRIHFINWISTQYCLDAYCHKFCQNCEYTKKNDNNNVFSVLIIIYELWAMSAEKSEVDADIEWAVSIATEQINSTN